MVDLFLGQEFAGFGPSALDPEAEAPSIYQVHGTRASALKVRVRQECPRRPGVYGMVDTHGELIYVGKAKCLRTRLLSYFRPRSRDAKAGRILQPTRCLVWEPVPNEFAALLRELELIRRWRPRFNVQGQPRRGRRVYVCLGRQPAPYAFLSERPPASARACFGPVPAGERAREAVRRLNDWYRLRDCPRKQEMVFADQDELFPVLRAAGCLRFEIGTCLGPCAAAVSRLDYARQVQAAHAFLAGTDTTALAELENAMRTAAAAQEFERAALWRDRFESLSWLREQLNRLRQACEHHSFVYPVNGHGGRNLWYLIHHGRVASVAPVPVDETSRQHAATALTAVYQAKRAGQGLPRPEDMDHVFLVSSWFRRYPEEMDRTLELTAARALCQGERGA